MWDFWLPPRFPKDSEVEICYLWYNIKTTVFASCYHRGIKTVACRQQDALLFNHLNIILGFSTLELGATRAGRQSYSILKQISNSG